MKKKSAILIQSNVAGTWRKIIHIIHKKIKLPVGTKMFLMQ